MYVKRKTSLKVLKTFRVYSTVIQMATGFPCRVSRCLFLCDMLWCRTKWKLNLPLIAAL